MLWRAGLAEYDELEGIAWEWQSIDGSMIKAPLAREVVGSNRRQIGEKMEASVICWWTSVVIPLSLVVTGANRHDVSQLEAVLDAIVIVRPEETEQHLCADKGYHGALWRASDRSQKLHFLMLRKRGRN